VVEQETESEQLIMTVDEPESGVLVIHLTGWLDLATAPTLEAGLQELFDTRTPRAVVLDLGDTEFLGSAGVSVLLRLHRRTTADGLGPPRLRRLNDCARRTLHALGLLDQFVVEPEPPSRNARPPAEAAP
jgi:anti-anti-sigma factor